MADDRPVFDQVNVIVGDMDATVEFYRRLGVVLPDDGPWNTYHRAAQMPEGLDLDFDLHSFATQWNEGTPTKGRKGVVLGFRVQTRAAVDRIHADMTKAGYRSQMEPYDAFWGSRYAVLEDPDGNAVGVMSPMEDEYRREPPAQ
jgi:catechol 2,3-dioxygenase-like lactoylglutathione lyase family enzyme